MKPETVEKIKDRIIVIRNRLDNGGMDPSWRNELEACESTLKWVLTLE